MSLFSRITILAFAFLVFSCGDDDEGPAYDFKDQTAQGLINGKSWSFVSGRSSVSNGELSVSLGADTDYVPCESFSINGLNIFFTVDNEVGLYELKFDFEDLDNSQTATFYDPDGGEFGLNIIAVEGAIEILSVSSSEVRGRLDIRDGDDNSSSVNGNFTVTLCE
ncbi:hypothetical protein [Reichenbachiella sp.]|uniref:hypothetical protein n=1 Tax=Reichenbachiella sp. TaxID=2184521 RepID=UPI003BB1166E